MTKQEAQKVFYWYFAMSSEAYLSNRYVMIEKKGFKPEEVELQKVIKQRVEGVDSLYHEMNRRALGWLIKLKDESI